MPLSLLPHARRLCSDPGCHSRVSRYHASACAKADRSRCSAASPPPALPTLPPETLLHILKSLQDIYSTACKDLYNCCLVARSFLDPARAVLYRTIEIENIDRSNDDGDDAEVDEGQEEPQGWCTKLIRSLESTLFFQAHLGKLVRCLEITCVYSLDPMAVTTPVALGSSVRSCGHLRELRVTGPHDDDEVRAVLDLVITPNSTLLRLERQCRDLPGTSSSTRFGVLQDCSIWSWTSCTPRRALLPPSNCGP